MNNLITFLGLSLIVIVTPGPDTAITIRNTVLGGRPSGIASAAGIACGQLVWACATSLGIVAALVASGPLFLTVKYAGAAYLIYLGLLALRGAVSPARAPEAAGPSGRPEPRSMPAASFRQGLVSNLGNPKMAVFFASLLPQFAPSGAPTLASLLMLGSIFAVMTFSWLVVYASLVARAGDFLRRPSIRSAIEGATGTLLIALGIRIATEHT